MDPLTCAATIVGLLAAIDSLINLCNKTIRLNKRLSWREREEIVCIVENLREGWEGLKIRIQRAEGNEINSNVAYSCILVSAKILSQLEYKCSQKKTLSKSTIQSIEQDLDKALILLTCVASAYPDRHSLQSFRSSHMDDLAEEMNKVRDVLVGGQERILSTREMKETGIYEQDDNFEPPHGFLRFMTREGSLYFVERLPLADYNEDLRRRSRLVAIALVLKKINVRTILPLTKVIEHSNGFCVLSKCTNQITLEQAVIENRIGNRKQVISDVCLAVYMIHNVLLLHKNIRLYNILVENAGVQLTGFSCSRFLQHESGAPRLEERERMIYSPSDDLCEFRFSWECDIYALGVVMLEVYSGRCFLNDGSIEAREDVREVARQAGGEMGELLRECILAPARNRPTAQKMLLSLDHIYIT